MKINFSTFPWKFDKERILEGFFNKKIQTLVDPQQARIYYKKTISFAFILHKLRLVFDFFGETLHNHKSLSIFLVSKNNVHCHYTFAIFGYPP